MSAWYENLSFAVVIVLSIMLLAFFVQSIMHDRNNATILEQKRKRRQLENIARYNDALQRMQLDNSTWKSIDDYYKVPPEKRAEIREVIDEVLAEKQQNASWTGKMISSVQGGVLIGALGGAIVNGYDGALGGAFSWSIIRGVITGINQNLNV